MTTRTRRARRTAWAALSVMIGGTLVACGGTGRPPEPRDHSAAASESASASASPTVVTLEVSGHAVGGQGFGSAQAEVVATLTGRLGEPDVSEAPSRFSRIPGHEGWFEVAGDTISPAWAYEYAARTCWGELCLVFGGDRAGDLRLRGWELARDSEKTPAETSYDVRLAGSGIALGDSWETVRAAYPGTVVDGGEGASLTIRDLPWPGFTDGVGAWRLTGTWDFDHPHRAPPDAVLIRISAGEGPEPGCC
ncbi:MAG: hypothetical protein KDB63_07345 [Nocardioidaceae bacterium]|nr:hypothetical protein [Nocardioidaceae bacterium]